MFKGHSRESGRARGRGNEITSTASRSLHLCLLNRPRGRGDEGTRGRGNEITLLSAFRAQNVIVIVMVIVLPSLQGRVGVRLPLTFYIYTESQRFIIKEEITMGCENL